MKKSLQVARAFGRTLLRNPLSPAHAVDHYVHAAPSAQNALDIFKGEWTSRLPGSFATLAAGDTKLFEDDRIQWAISQFGPASNKSVLELGPLEGGHSYMLEKAGFASVLAIEGNTRAYLKCLVVKELLHLSHVEFLCGDFVEYLRQTPVRFDCVVASGVLYHMVQPVELLSLLSRATDRLFLWTHYYDSSHARAKRFKAPQQTSHEGFKHTLYRQQYRTSAWGGFCGGASAYSHWMTREDILTCLRHFGLEDIRTAFEEPNHSNGPSFALVAQRNGA
jgi:hypothetical protein